MLRSASSHSAFPYLAAFVLLLPTLLWIALDNHVWHWDDSSHAIATLDLWACLVHTPSQWLGAVIDALPLKPPAIVWFGQFFVPLEAATHSVESALLLSIMLVQFATLILSYSIGFELLGGNKAVSWMGQMAMASTPLFIYFGHEYMGEPLQLFAVTYVYWLATKMEKMNAAQVALHLLWAVTIVALTKISTPGFCWAPTLLILVNLWRRLPSWWRGSHEFSLGARLSLASGTFLLGLTVAWYFHNFPKAMDYSLFAFALHHVPARLSDYPVPTAGANISYPARIGWWLAVLTAGFSSVTILLVGCVLRFVSKVGVLHVFRSITARDNKALLAAAAALNILTMVMVLGLSDNLQPRYGMPLLPSLFFLLMWFLSQEEISMGRSAFLIVSLLLAIHFAVIETHDLTAAGASQSELAGCQRADDPIGRFLRASGAFRLSDFRRSAAQKDEVQRLVEMTRVTGAGLAEKRSPSCVACGVGLPSLNYTLLGFYATKARYRCGGSYPTFLSLGQSLSRDRRVMKRLQPDFFISNHEGLLVHTDINHDAVELLDLVMNDPDYVRIPFDSKTGILLFRRRNLQ